MLVDSHVNLHSEKYADDLPAVMADAAAAGVTAMLTISDKIASTEAIKAIARAYPPGRRPMVWRSVGAHPHYANEHQDLSAQQLIDLARDDDVVGIGECGLDFHYNYSPETDQRRVFDAHIEAAQETGLPLIIHTREADDMMRDTLTAAMKAQGFTPLLHCYTGGPDLAAAVVEMGGYVSFSGIITFKNAEEVRDVARNTPLERIIIETDCPYLAPVPKRGRRNEPAFLVHVAEKLTELKGVDFAAVEKATTENFFSLFSRANPDRPSHEE